MSLILHLETATKVCSVALSRDGEQIAIEEISDDNYAHGEKLTLLIEKVLKTAGAVTKDLSAVSVSAGPGSYTGLRIGVSTAKGLCYALGIPLISVNSLESMAVLGNQAYPQTNLCPMIDARRMEVYSAIYARDLSILKPLSADVLDESSYGEFGEFVFFGDGAPKAAELWQSRKLVFDKDLAPSASGQVMIAFDKWQKGVTEDVAYFEPYYLKEFAGTMPKSKS